MNRETDSPDSRLEVGEPNLTYRHVRRQPDNPEDEVWVEIRLDADWVAACLVQPEDGQPVIAGVRVLPYEDDAERSALLGPGESSRRRAPRGGVPFEKLGKLQAEDLLQVIQEHLEQWPHDAEYLDEVLADFGFGREPATDLLPRRQRRADLDVARAARAYAGAKRGSRRRAVADECRCSLSNADKLIRDAKDRGFLAGGRLTDRGRELLL